MKTRLSRFKLDHAVAQDDDLQKQIDLLTKQKQLADAQKALTDAQKAVAQAQQDAAQKVTDLQNQKALADAQKGLFDSQKALSDAKRSADPTQAENATKLAELQNQKALLDAQKGIADSKKALDQAAGGSAQQLTDLQNQKALADAQKALADSQTQATLARFIGDVKAGPFSGSVDLKERGGTEEAALLAARAVREAAEIIAKKVHTLGAKFYLFASKDLPSFQRLLTFRFRKDLVKQAFAAANVRKPIAAAEAAPVVTAALVSAGLDAASKLLGFFKTDFTVGGTEVKLDESLLLFAVAGALAHKEVHLPLVYEPKAPSDALESILVEMAELTDLRTRAANEARTMQENIAASQKQAADPANAPKKDEIAASIATDQKRLDQLNGVVTVYDTFASSLTAADSGGSVPLAAVALELAIQKALATEGAVVLLLRLESSGGGYLIKKNLLTGLWKMPLFHMGGATVSYLALKGPDGRVAGGDVVPVHGGFVASDEIRDELLKMFPTR